MKSILLNILWTALFWIGLFLLVVMCRPLWAGDYPCQDTGFVGHVIGDTPNGPVVVAANNIYAASYNDTQYFFEFLPDYHRLIVPLESIVSANFSIAKCSYKAEYNDDVFTNSFEGN